MEHASFLSFYVTLYRCASGPDFTAINHTRWRSVFTFGIIWPAFLGVICPNRGNTVVVIVEGRETLCDQCALYPRFPD